MLLWEIFVAFILATVEGLTEFAPVSSTGHMILVKNIILNYNEPKGEVFIVVVQLGSILAVTVIYWERLLSILGLKSPTQKSAHVREEIQISQTHDEELLFKRANITRSRKEIHKKNYLSIIHILIGMAPAVIIGALFYDNIKEVMGSTHFVILALVAGGVLMILAEIFKPATRTKTLDEVTYGQALTVGLFQCLALWSGFSRSGSMMSGGLLAGMDRKIAADFAFILGLPMMVGASTKDLYESWDMLTINDLPFFSVGFITAFIVSVLSIKFFLSLLKRFNLVPFAIYRFILAGVIIFVVWYFDIQL